MKVIKKVSLMAALVIALSSASITPAMAAPADDAAEIVKFIASGLKGLGGMNARLNARMLRDALRGHIGELKDLSPLEQAQFISSALDRVAVDLGIPRGTIANVVADAFELPPGSTFTIGDTTFSITDDGTVLGGDAEEPVSAG